MPADIPNRRIRGSKTVTSSPRRGATVSLVTARWRSTKSRKPTKGSTSARWRSSRVWTATRRKWTSRFSVSSPRFVLRRTGWKFWAEGRGRRGEIRRPGQRHGGSERQGFRSVPPDLYSDGRGGNFGQRGGVGGGEIEEAWGATHQRWGTVEMCSAIGGFFLTIVTDAGFSSRVQAPFSQLCTIWFAKNASNY